MAAMLPNVAFNAAACAAASNDPALLATDLADYLVRRGMAFRQAHHVVGAVVALAEKRGKRLNELTLDELRSVDASFGNDAGDVFNVGGALSRRRMTGAPALPEVRKQLKRWKQLLS
jgi:argininosuccinate lyase